MGKSDQSAPKVHFDIHTIDIKPTSRPGPKKGDKVMCPDGEIREWDGVAPDVKVIKARERR